MGRKKKLKKQESAPPPRRLKSKCCRKYRKKGKYCKRCPVRAVLNSKSRDARAVSR